MKAMLDLATKSDQSEGFAMVIIDSEITIGISLKKTITTINRFIEKEIRTLIGKPKIVYMSGIAYSKAKLDILKISANLIKPVSGQDFTNLFELLSYNMDSL